MLISSLPSRRFSGLPQAWVPLLATLGFSEDEITAIRAGRTVPDSDLPRTVHWQAQLPSHALRRSPEALAGINASSLSPLVHETPTKWHKCLLKLASNAKRSEISKSVCLSVSDICQ